MNRPVIATNLYPGHMHYDSVRHSLASGGYELVNFITGEDSAITYDGPAVAQFIFNYPMNALVAQHVISLKELGQPFVVFMDDPLAFFDLNINKAIEPVLLAATRVYTSTDNMLPIYLSMGIKAELLVGLGNPQFDIAEPVEEGRMRFDWGFIGGLYPQRFRFFWQLKRLLPELTHYIVTEGFGVEAVIERIRETRINIAYGNFSDITDFKSNGTTLRAWEFPYAGAFILHDERPLIRDYFVDGESIVTFKTVEECADLIRHYAPLADERNRIAAKAREIIHSRSMLQFFPRLFRELTDDG
ncbi:MAG TPA: glycosyltransferase [Pyrinomonadaceae bacterium]|jgi:hypothetical protein|nr:glycosyltransferase [Pyrinomonadaceae bacterium]